MRTHMAVCVFAMISGVLGTASAAAASTVYVANNGVDGGGCGSSAQPCRSISRGIANAQAGDTVLVGPGIYGDLNRDRDFNDPGEEAAEPTGPGYCVVCIGKRVRVLSTQGAEATRIESLTTLFNEDDSELQALVLIRADGVTFGGPGQGFELTGKPFSMLKLAARGNVTISDIVARRAEPRVRDPEQPTDFGFLINAVGGAVYLTHNTSINSHFGYSAGGTASLVFTNNAAVDNTWEGFVVGGPGVRQLIGNYASGNGSAAPMQVLLPFELRYPLATGFDITAANVRLENNLSIGNYGPGFQLTNTATGNPTQWVAKRNSATGNQGPGILVGAGGVLDVRSNNVYGNRGLTGHPAEATGCGLINESGKTIYATQSFWGASTGPGGDPADLAGPGSGCDRGQGSTTQVAPFAATEVAVTP